MPSAYISRLPLTTARGCGPTSTNTTAVDAITAKPVTRSRPGRQPQSTTRYATLLTLAMLLIAAPISWSSESETSNTTPVSAVDLHARLAAAVVAITCNGPMGSYYGTGAVVDPDGWVLSNTTVVPAGATNIRVTFTDGRIIDGELVRTDEATEAALIRVAARDLVAMPLADSDTSQVGDPVYTWGNPFGVLQQDGSVSLSRGVISGRYHAASVDDQSRYHGPVIETDAAVNPGSDGGPLTDHEGRLIGIQSLAFSATRWLGLSIPARDLYNALPELHHRPLVPGCDREAMAQAWPLEHAFSQARAAVDQAVVGVVRFAEGDDPWPAQWPITAPARAAYPGRFHARYEVSVPETPTATGVIIDPSGIVVTSSLALGRRSEHTGVSVYLADGRLVSASVLGRLPREDVAVLQLDEPGPYPAIELAAAPPPPVATPIAVLGRSEAGDHSTMCLGRISARQRDFGRLFQHSACMNYGSSGGAIIDQHGTLIGIANMLHPGSRWRQNCGVGFALRSDRLAAILPLLQAGESVPDANRLQPGLLPAPVDNPDLPGLPIAGVTDDSPAAAAGIRRNDRLIAINGQDVSTWGATWHQLAGLTADSSMALQIQRGDQTIEVQLQVPTEGDAE